MLQGSCVVDVMGGILCVGYSVQYIMILHPASTLITILLATLVTSVRWVKKLNPNFFQVENERGVTEVEEGDGCKPGFFCMFFEDGDAKDEMIVDEEKPKTFLERVECDA